MPPTSKKKVPQKKIFKSTPKRKVIKPEVKHFDNQNFVTILNTGNCFYNLSQITTQGTADGQRIGDKVVLKKCYVRYKIEYNPTSGINQTLRVMFLIDLQGFNTPSVNDVLDPFLLGTGYAPVAQYNHLYMTRFKVLKDTLISMSPGERTCYARFHKLPLNIIAEYAGASTYKNQLLVLIVSDDSNILTAPTVRWQSRILYADN